MLETRRGILVLLDVLLLTLLLSVGRRYSIQSETGFMAP